MKPTTPLILIFLLYGGITIYISFMITRDHYDDVRRSEKDEFMLFRSTGFNHCFDNFTASAKKVQEFNAKGQLDSALYHCGQMAVWLEAERYFMADTTKKK